MSIPTSGEAYTNGAVPILSDAMAVRAFGGPLGWLSIELGKITRALRQSTTRTVTSATTVKQLDGLVLADATTAPFTVTLPDPNTVPSMVVTIKRVNAGGNAVTIGGTVDGTLNPTLGSRYASKTVQASIPTPGNGAWFTIASV